MVMWKRLSPQVRTARPARMTAAVTWKARTSSAVALSSVVTMPVASPAMPGARSRAPAPTTSPTGVRWRAPSGSTMSVH